MSIPVTDAGFRHGRGVFETLQVVGGKALFQEWHEESMSAAADALGIDRSPMFFLDQPPGRQGIWRWFLTESGIETHFDARPEPVPEAYSLSLSRLRLNPQGWDARYKTLSYLTHVQAREEAESDEAVLLNTREQLASASMANLFWVQAGRLHTPSGDCGCREGVVRRWVIERSGLDASEGVYPLEFLDKAEEIFLTNSRIGILPVHQWRQRKLRPGPVTTGLWKKYQQLLG